jgi:hypothetical protein
MTKRRRTHGPIKLTLGAGSFAAVLAIAIALLVSGKSSVVQAGAERPQYIEIPKDASQPFATDTIQSAPAVRYASFGIPLTVSPNEPAVESGLSANQEVVLTARQAELVKAFDEYLKQRGESAVLTSGKRTPESQLAIIKDRIEELGAVRKFVRLAEATVADANVWLPAWRWLVARGVPVNAPAAVPGRRVRTSAHLEGRAIDIISHDLDHLKTIVAGFMRSPYARQADMKIAGILREPGCLHLTLG